MLDRGPITWNTLKLNDQTKRSLVASPYYWYRVTSVDGIFTTDLRLDVHPIPHGHGERAFDSFRSGKRITITGVLIARELTPLRNGMARLAQACWDLKQHNLTFMIAGASALMRCRMSQDLIMPDAWETEYYNRHFTFQLMAPDPTIYEADGVTPFYDWMTPA